MNGYGWEISVLGRNEVVLWNDSQRCEGFTFSEFLPLISQIEEFPEEMSFDFTVKVSLQEVVFSSSSNYSGRSRSSAMCVKRGANAWKIYEMVTEFMERVDAVHSGETQGEASQGDASQSVSENEHDQ